MINLNSYPLAVVLLLITMLSWGSWANTQKLVTRSKWPFQLFYWDYSLGIIIMALVFGLTIGNMGTEGRGFIEDLAQASLNAVVFALLGGIVFNLANILIVAAIDIAGMSVAFPIGIGIALVEGTIINYLSDPTGNAFLIFTGVSLVTLAIIIDAIAYRRLPKQGKVTSTRGIVISIAGGLLMGLFFYLVQVAIAKDFSNPEPGKMEPFAAVFIFSIGLFLSNFIWNSWFMAKPFAGEKVKYSHYFTEGNTRIHIVGILGGIIWCIGMSFANYTSGVAGDAISYGLGQGATMVAAIWGVFIWKEFKEAPIGTNKLLALMFFSFITGLGLLIYARIA
jgi:glucose uptake protein